ncbi:MAG: ABC transporter substrate-binding protein [bacterium]|nr:ABC transporter substrate-binding protein [bacterium]
MKKKLICALLACLLLLSMGCAGEKPQTTLRIAALKGPTGMGLAYLMQEESSAFSVELLDAPDVVTGKFINGEIDIAAVPVNLAAVLSNKTDGKAVMIAVNTLGVLYILENGETVHSMEDLAGKTLYATGQGSTPQYVLEYLLEQNGLKDRVTVEYIAEHATLAAMAASGEAPLAMLPEPNVSSVLLKNESARIALDLTSEWDAVSDAQLLQGCYIVQRSVLESEPEAVRAFLSAAAESAARVNSEAEAPALIAELGIVGSEAIAARAIPNCNIVCLTGEQMQEAAEAMLSVLFAANPKSIGGQLPDASFYAKLDPQ